ncbi:molybdopterin binding domain-containing protein [Pseudodesulfovibrio mercurii]|uniref:Molybdopterin molybdenumtransferase n=1 Tax=Pseudodesulfovibrio mercurii TaxID=641491 RepID=F0JJF7_9BACT|nr:molybdopterin-binding protein [Pseudodesulfovibrio mercurii]EGB16056.1 molybdopterin binding domain-containing protein [Pseudodesulfovibrio mercurii]
MKVIDVEDAIGTVLCHDITRIIPGQSKGPGFRRGHVVRPEDVSELRKIGKEHLYVLDLADGYVHEDDAARRIARAAAGPGLELNEPVEGKVTFTAAMDGLVNIDATRLLKLNSLGDVLFATIHGNQLVRKGRHLAGVRVLPLAVPEELVADAERLLAEGEPMVRVRALKPARVGIVVTGSEVYKGLIKDKFGPVVQGKFESYGCTVLGKRLVSDDEAMTAKAIRRFLSEGAEFIVVTGGMSVDPDDRTPAAIRAAGAEVVTYGAPILPGAMFMLARIGDVPVLGLPGCVMYYRASIFDLVVPRLLSGEAVTRDDILALGYGGFCEGCATCRYPVCGFGKGM